MGFSSACESFTKQSQPHDFLIPHPTYPSHLTTLHNPALQLSSSRGDHAHFNHRKMASSGSIRFCRSRQVWAGGCWYGYGGGKAPCSAIRRDGFRPLLDKNHFRRGGAEAFVHGRGYGWAPSHPPLVHDWLASLFGISQNSASSNLFPSSEKKHPKGNPSCLCIPQPCCFCGILLSFLVGSSRRRPCQQVAPSCGTEQSYSPLLRQPVRCGRQRPWSGGGGLATR